MFVAKWGKDVSKWWVSRRRGRFTRLKPTSIVRPVAKWLFRRLPTTAKCHGRLIGRDWETISQVIDNRNGTFDQERTILTGANRDVGHALLLAL
jgi:hypothetical protein